MRVNKGDEADGVVHLLRFKREIILLFVFVFTLLTVYFAYVNKPTNYLRVSFLDVGQGDAVLFETPHGANILVDGGRDNTVLTKLGEELKLGEKDIDIVIATHDDSDHITGLIDVIKKYNVKVLLYSLPNSDSILNKKLMEVAKNKDTKVIQISKPMIVRSEDGLLMKILFPVVNMDGTIASNDASVVTQFIYGKTKFLLTGDLPQSGEVFLVNRYGDELKSDVLKLGHHGSDTSSNSIFLQTVEPEIAVVSAGKNNSFGHPHRAILDLLEKFNIKVFRTDIDGTVHLYSNGLNIWKE